MTTAFVALGTIVVVVVLVSLLWNPLRTYLRSRGDRLVSCPDNGETVAVQVDAAHAALTGRAQPTHFRIESCSRWPEKAGCGQACLRQIEAQPDDCLVRNQVARWYADKSCALCGKDLGQADWSVHAPALRAPDGVTTEWPDVDPELLPAVLASHSAVCWDCHVAETFRRTHPELVIDNPHATPR